MSTLTAKIVMILKKRKERTAPKIKVHYDICLAGQISVGQLSVKPIHAQLFFLTDLLESKDFHFC